MSNDGSIYSEMSALALLKENADLRAQLAAATKRIEEVEKQEPVGYCDEEQFKRWDVLRGTEYESPERCYLPFSRAPFESDISKCDMPLYTRPIPPADVGELQRALDCINELHIIKVNAYEQRIAEFERKLATWQVFSDTAQDIAAAARGNVRRLDPARWHARVMRLLDEITFSDTVSRNSPVVIMPFSE